LELKTLWCWKQTHKREKILTVSFDQKGTGMYSLQLSGHVTTKWLTEASPISLTQCTCPLPGICPGQRFTIFLDWLKALGGGLGHAIWRTIFVGNGVVQESGRRNRNSLNNASHLRWWPEEF
jgi:hypothetical protein